MLRYLQSKIVRGRFLDVKDNATYIEETNFIAVDRDNILETTLDELKSVEDPRNNFLRRVLWRTGSGQWRTEKRIDQTLQSTYFDCGLKKQLKDYYFVAQMAAIALLQKGQAPNNFFLSMKSQ